MDIFAGTGIPGLDDSASTDQQSPIGLPTAAAAGQDNQPQGFDTTQATQAAPPAISTSQSWWDTIKNDSSGAVNWLETKASNAASSVESGASSALSSAENAVTAPLKSTYTYLIIGVVVLAGALYFIGKGGAIGQAASFGRP